jgi:murein DD-endopeptidase MepM/ murein hydrolase activator NlpD
MLTAWGASLLVIGLLGSSLVAFTPLRTFIPGYGTKQLKQQARLNALRVDALQDSVAVQQHYIKRLQQLVTGRVDSIGRRAAVQESPPPQPSRREPPSEPLPSTDVSDNGRQRHEQPAVSVSSFPASEPAGEEESAYVLPSLSLPVRAPVNTGFPTRDFDAGDAHYGIDIAVSEGTLVRAVGEGYVVLADWTQGAGYTVAVQHSDGYLSVYKHNKRLLKQTGDRVQAREAVAVSGSSGEVTTGPHLHFELWQNGLAQDPRPYVTGW